MLPKSKDGLYAAIRRDSRHGLSNRALQRKYGVEFLTVQKVLPSTWPEPRKQLPPRATRLDPFKPLIDEMLRANLDGAGSALSSGLPTTPKDADLIRRVRVDFVRRGSEAILLLLPSVFPWVRHLAAAELREFVDELTHAAQNVHSSTSTPISTGSWPTGAPQPASWSTRN